MNQQPQENDDQQLGVSIDEMLSLIGRKDLEIVALSRQIAKLQRLVDTLALKPAQVESED
jgi:hypothetical protein